MKQIKRGILSFAAVLILWQLLITLTHVSSALFPAPLDVVNAFRALPRCHLFHISVSVCCDSLPAIWQQ